MIVLTEEVLSVDSAMTAVSRDCAGGISIFVGTTRDNFEGKTVVRLEYEAYHAMAVKEMRSLCDTARSKWPQITAIAIMHRLGVVPVREASVIIAVSSPHRIDAIGTCLATHSAFHFLPYKLLTYVPACCVFVVEACHSLIDELKARVPIWKKEIYEQGSEWKANKEFKV